jgi:hypothetical protein
MTLETWVSGSAMTRGANGSVWTEIAASLEDFVRPGCDCRTAHDCESLDPKVRFYKVVAEATDILISAIGEKGEKDAF